jgi:hypothetical protein
MTNSENQNPFPRNYFLRSYMPALRGTVRNLNEISDEMLAHLRATNNVIAARLMLSLYVEPSIKPYVWEFVLAVVFGDRSPREWRRGVVLAPSWSLANMLVVRPDQLLAPIVFEGFPIDCRFPPIRREWEQGVDVVGAPAVRRPDIDYTWKAGPHLSGGPIGSETEPLGDLDVAVRRWIAARLAMWLRTQDALLTVASAEEMYRIAEVDPARVTDTAACAAAGLLAERPLWAASPDGVPGFVGPDEFYRRRGG